MVRGGRSAVLKLHVIEECIVLTACILTCRYLTANSDRETVVPETLSELKRVVGVHLTSLIRVVLHINGEIESAKCRTSNLIDFLLQERTECRVHSEARSIVLGEIHTRSKHRDSKLTTFLYGFRLQFITNRRVIKRINDELKSHVLKCLRQYHATVKGDRLLSITEINGCFVLLNSRYAQSWVHHIARELDIRAVFYLKGLQRNDRQRIFHLTCRDSISTCHADITTQVLHSQGTFTKDVKVVGVVGVKPTGYVGILFNGNREVHRHTIHLRTIHGQWFLVG